MAIVAFIRVGEKLLQRFGPRRPMIWGSLIVGASILLLTPTYVMLETYKILAIVAFTLFGIGLAFYATPSTDAALANLPDNAAGAGSGIYKMASSLGASFGVAISAAIFTALSADNSPVDWIAGLITFAGRQDNVALRQAALVSVWRKSPDGGCGDHLNHADGAKGPGTSGGTQIGASQLREFGFRALRRMALRNAPSQIDLWRRSLEHACDRRGGGIAQHAEWIVTGGDGLIGDHTLNERDQNRSHLPQREASACPQLREINQFVEGAG